MAKYKLIVIAGDEAITGEYENRVNSLEEAEVKADELLTEYLEDYPDTYIACYPYDKHNNCPMDEDDENYDEDVRYPYNDYRCWVRDCFGDTYWKWMKVSERGSRLYMYLK